MRSDGSYTVRWAGPPGWRAIPPVTRTALALAGAGYLLGLLVPGAAFLLAAIPSRILAGEVWRLVTYPLVIAGIVNVLFALLLLWSFGTEMEAVWGSRRFALFLVAASASAAALGTLAALALGTGLAVGAGMSGLLTALIVAWALRGLSLPANLFGVLPMTRGVFALLALVLVVFSEIEATRSLAQLVFVLGGLPVAWLFSARRPSGRPPTFRPRRFRNPFRRRRFTVVGGGWNGPVN